MTDKIQTDTTNLGSREQAILEKYDRESVTRQTNPLQKGLITVIAVCYSLFHLYITFYPLPTLLQRAIHVGVGAILIFFNLSCDTKTSAGWCRLV